jgi:hypothetical protein
MVQMHKYKYKHKHNYLIHNHMALPILPISTLQARSTKTSRTMGNNINMRLRRNSRSDRHHRRIQQPPPLLMHLLLRNNNNNNNNNSNRFLQGRILRRRTYRHIHPGRAVYRQLPVFRNGRLLALPRSTRNKCIKCTNYLQHHPHRLHLTDMAAKARHCRAPLTI